MLRGERAEAGLDQLTQAAGRCNREGRRPVEDSIVTIFKPAEARASAEIKGLIGDMLRILGEHCGDLFSPQTIEAYFREAYWRKSDQGLDKYAVMEKFILESSGTDFAYRSVAEQFRLIESGMEAVIVAIDEEPQAILRALGGGMPPRLAARRLQNYIVQVPPRDRGRLIENGHVRFVEDFGDQFAVLRTETSIREKQGWFGRRPTNRGLTASSNSRKKVGEIPSSRLLVLDMFRSSCNVGLPLLPPVNPKLRIFWVGNVIWNPSPRFGEMGAVYAPGNEG